MATATTPPECGRITCARATVGVVVTALLGGCPAPTPDSRPNTGQRTRASPAHDDAPGPPTTSTVDRTATTDDTHGTPSPSTLPAHLPSTLRAPGVRSVVHELWLALEAVDAGDPDAIATMMPSGTWLPPGGPADAVTGADPLRRAMAPWTRPGLDIAVRAVIDLGGRLVTMLVTVGPDGGGPSPRYEMVLMLEHGDEGDATMRHYGDPLGPVRSLPADVGGTLAVGPVPAEPAVHGGPPVVAHVAATRTLLAALGPNPAPTPPPLATTVVLHDIVARRTHRGPDAYLAEYRATLGPTGHIQVSHHYAGRHWVIVEGTIHGQTAAPGQPPGAHGFADVHRLEHGQIVETWHYFNRRGRPDDATAPPVSP